MIEKKAYFEPRIKKFYISQLALIQSKTTPLELVNSASGSKIEKLAGIINSPNYIFPFYSQMIAGKIFSLKKIPLKEDLKIPEYVRNDGKIIYFFNHEEKKYVLKSYKFKYNDQKSIFSYAKNLNNEYLTLKEWFKDFPKLLPEEMILIFSDNLKNKPTVGIIQNFIEEEKIDIFDKTKENYLISCLRKNPETKSEFEGIVKTIEKIYFETGSSLDLYLGNLFLVKNLNPESYDFIYLDTHPIYNKEMLKNKPSKKIQTEQAIQNLASIVKRI